MSLPLGRTNNPMGRPKGSGGSQHAQSVMGSLNIRTLRRLVDAYERDSSLLTPLEIMFTVMTSHYPDGSPVTDAEGNPIQFDWKMMLAAADKAMPYFHNKLPQPVEVSGVGGGPITVSHSTARLEDLLFGTVVSLETVEDGRPEQLSLAAAGSEPVVETVVAPVETVEPSREG